MPLSWRTPLVGRRSLVIERLEDRLVPSTLIWIDRRDMVFDPVRDLLYTTTSKGTVLRYDVAHQVQLSPLNVGTSLNGADITPDGSSLYVTESQTSSGNGILHKVDLASGTVTDLTYSLVGAETGSFDIALGPNGKGLFDGQYSGSGPVPLRQVDLNTNALSIRTDDPGTGFSNQLTPNTLIHRSADRSRFAVSSGGMSPGFTFTYNALTDTFAQGASGEAFQSAVNRNGTLIALQLNGSVTVMDAGFHTVKALTGLGGGVAFDPVRDVLYAVNISTSQLVAYDTNTWAVLYQVDVGDTPVAASPFGYGVMTTSNDGGLLFLATQRGVCEYNLNVPRLVVSGFPASTPAGTPGSFTVTALDYLGRPATNFIGTVHFSSWDSKVSLPPDYTFTGADAGSHTFTATFIGAGTYDLTATAEVAGAPSGAQANVVVTPLAPSYLQVFGYPSPTTAGASQRPTVAACDTYGNWVTGYTGTIHFTSSDPAAILPADYSFNSADHGSHWFYNVILRTAGTQSLTATDLANAALTGQQSGIVVNPNPAAAAFLLVSGYPLTTTAGASHTFTVTAYDASDNVATSYTDTVHFTSTDPAASLPPDYTFTSADLGSHTFSATLMTPGTQTLAAADLTNRALAYQQSGITVNPRPPVATSLAVGGYPSPATAGTSQVLTVTARDDSGNVVTGYTGTVHFTSTDPAASLPPDYTFTAADRGTHTFAIVLKTAGNQSLAVTDTANPALAGTQSGISVTPALPSVVTVAGLPSPAAAGRSVPFTLSIRDAYGNLATGYTSTVHFTSTDPAASLPPDYTFTAADLGAHAFSATFATAGTQTITATPAPGQPLQLDSSFGSGGLAQTSLSGHIYPPSAGLALQPDGKIVAATDSSASAWEVTRLLPGGAVDPSFGTSGVTITSFTNGTYPIAHKVLVQPDGKILVGGGFGGGSGGSLLVRYNANGTVDTSFGSNGIVTPGGVWISDMVLRPDGRILLSLATEGTVYMLAAQLTVAGGYDPSFAFPYSTINDSSEGLTLLDDGRFLLAGEFGTVARFLANGTLDTTFGNRGTLKFSFNPDNAGIDGITHDSLGRVLVWGAITQTVNATVSAIDMAAARLTADGHLDTSFGGTGIVATGFAVPSGPTAAVMQADGKLILAGFSETTANAAESAMARFNPDGSLDSTFGDQGRFSQLLTPNNWERILGTALQPDGKLLALVDCSGGDRVARFNLPTEPTLTAGDTVTVLAPPTVTGAVLNGTSAALAGAQRSMVDSLAYTFDHAVSVGAGAFTIALHQNVTVNGVSGQAVGTLPTLIWSSPDGGLTWVVTFSGAGVVNGSIADGVYDVTLSAAAVTDAVGQALATNRTDTFFRLYGDTNGDGTVNNSDAFQFKSSFLHSAGDAAYLASLDYNGDGTVNNSDAFQLKKRFLTAYSGFAATV
jgi:uncharacterized delta-60 repeat protein